MLKFVRWFSILLPDCAYLFGKFLDPLRLLYWLCNCMVLQHFFALAKSNLDETRHFAASVLAYTDLQCSLHNYWHSGSSNLGFCPTSERVSFPSNCQSWRHISASTCYSLRTSDDVTGKGAWPSGGAGQSPIDTLYIGEDPLPVWIGRWGQEVFDGKRRFHTSESPATNKTQQPTLLHRKTQQRWILVEGARGGAQTSHQHIGLVPTPNRSFAFSRWYMHDSEFIVLLMIVTLLILSYACC